MVQAAHAAYQAGQISPEAPKDIHLVLCGIPSENKLLEEAAKLEARGIAYTLFQEPDLNNQFTALATTPISHGCRRFFRSWQLWKG